MLGVGLEDNQTQSSMPWDDWRYAHTVTLPRCILFQHVSFCGTVVYILPLLYAFVESKSWYNWSDAHDPMNWINCMPWVPTCAYGWVLIALKWLIEYLFSYKCQSTAQMQGAPGAWKQEAFFWVKAYDRSETAMPECLQEYKPYS